MSSSLLAMGVFTLVGAITPGPVNVLALRHGAARSRLVSAAYVLGASASYAAVVWVMGQGAQWLLQTLPLTVDASLASALTSMGVLVTPETPGYPVLRLALKDVAQILPYLLMVLILIFRPKGLLGTRED